MLTESKSLSKKKIATLLFGLGGGVLGCGIAMLLTGRAGAPDAKAAAAASPAVAPVRVERGDAPVLGPKIS